MSEIKVDQYEETETRRVTVQKLRVELTREQLLNFLRMPLREIHPAFDGEIEMQACGGYCEEEPDRYVFIADLEAPK